MRKEAKEWVEQSYKKNAKGMHHKMRDYPVKQKSALNEELLCEYPTSQVLADYQIILSLAGLFKLVPRFTLTIEAIGRKEEVLTVPIYFVNRS